MPRVILSWPGLIWISLSLLSTLGIIASFLSASWLRRIDSAESRKLTDCPVPRVDLTQRVITTPIRRSTPPSLGPWLRCQSACQPIADKWPLVHRDSHGVSEQCQLAMWGFGIRPAQGSAIIWTAAVMCLIGCGLLLVAQLFVILSLCKREICSRSWLSFTASILGLADLLLVVGLIIWPIGWDSVTVREVCGGSVSPYNRGNCTLGRPWPVVLGTGLGLGMGISNCNNDFKQPFPLVSHRIMLSINPGYWKPLVWRRLSRCDCKHLSVNSNTAPDKGPSNSTANPNKAIPLKIVHHYGTPDSVSNIRPLSFRLTGQETKLQKKYCSYCDDTWKWMDEYWTGHNKRMLQDVNEVIVRATACGVRAAIVLTEERGDIELALKLKERFPDWINLGFGIHPIQDMEGMKESILKYADQLVTIGEIGLDFTADICPTVDIYDIQRSIFSGQIRIARQLDLPVNVHSRSAPKATLEVLKAEGATRVQMHAFDGRPSQAMPGVAAGYYFSIPTSVVRSKQKQELIKAVPLTQLLLETDAPVLGVTAAERNEPSHLIKSCEFIAQTKGLDVETVKQITTENALKLYPKLCLKQYY